MTDHLFPQALEGSGGHPVAEYGRARHPLHFRARQGDGGGKKIDGFLFILHAQEDLGRLEGKPAASNIQRMFCQAGPEIRFKNRVVEGFLWRFGKAILSIGTNCKGFF